MAQPTVEPFVNVKRGSFYQIKAAPCFVLMGDYPSSHQFWLIKNHATFF